MQPSLRLEVETEKNEAFFIYRMERPEWIVGEGKVHEDNVSQKSIFWMSAIPEVQIWLWKLQVTGGNCRTSRKTEMKYTHYCLSASLYLPAPTSPYSVSCNKQIITLHSYIGHVFASPFGSKLSIKYNLPTDTVKIRRMRCICIYLRVNDNSA